MSSTAPALFEAATTIILSKSSRRLRNVCNFRALLMKRNTRSSFMPGNYVFPGGALEKADFDSEWIELYKKMGEKSSIRNYKNLPVIQGLRPELMLKERNSLVSNEMAFKICAIRETFEESGILILRSFSNDSLDVTSCEDASLSQRLAAKVENIKEWREAVHGSATEFVKLCRELECVPDIWSLHEWQNWITPLISNKRFNTIFYTCFFNHHPKVQQDDKELISFQWSSPLDAVNSARRGDISLAPPQEYELRRLCMFDSWDSLKQFSSEREAEGCETFLPSIHKFKDVILSVMPGDAHYEEALSGNICEEKLNWQHPEKEDLPFHRQIHMGNHDTPYIIQNYTPKCGHFLPYYRDVTTKIRAESKI